MQINLSPDEKFELFKQNPATHADGGFQALLTSLQARVANDNLTLTPEDLERIPRYAFDYGNGGWEGRLKAIFSAHLGASLGR